MARARLITKGQGKDGGCRARAGQPATADHGRWAAWRRGCGKARASPVRGGASCAASWAARTPPWEAFIMRPVAARGDATRYNAGCVRPVWPPVGDGFLAACGFLLASWALLGRERGRVLVSWLQAGRVSKGVDVNKSARHRIFLGRARGMRTGSSRPPEVQACGDRCPGLSFPAA